MAQWSSKQANWFSGSKPLAETFTPTVDKLIFGELLNAPVDPEGFICAFFQPNIVVDSMGQTKEVSQEQFNAIVELALRASALPDTGSFRNTWRVQSPITSRPIRILRFKRDKESFKETSVYGFSKEQDILEEPVNGFTKLPAELMELFGLLDETRENYQKGRENAEVVTTIKKLLEAGLA